MRSMVMITLVETGPPCIFNALHSLLSLSSQSTTLHTHLPNPQNYLSKTLPQTFDHHVQHIRRFYQLDLPLHNGHLPSSTHSPETNGTLKDAFPQSHALHFWNHGSWSCHRIRSVILATGDAGYAPAASLDSPCWSMRSTNGFPLQNARTQGSGIPRL